MASVRTEWRRLKNECRGLIAIKLLHWAALVAPDDPGGRALCIGVYQVFASMRKEREAIDKAVRDA